MVEKLEGCPTPWCDSDEQYVWQGADARFCVICGGCQVEGPAADDKQDAIFAWNTRPSTEQTEWIEWRGGKCPVHPGTLVERRYREAEELGFAAPADMFRWEHTGNTHDIMEYREISA